MGAVKNWMMNIEEFCDDYFHAGEPYGVMPSAEEVAGDAAAYFNSKVAGAHAKEYVTKTLGEI